MDTEQDRVASLEALVSEMRDKEYRDQYVEAFNRQLLARQMRSLRGDRSQAEYGAALDKSQTQIARFEDPTYGWQTRTVFEIGRKENVAAIVCFVDFETFLQFEGSMSERMLTPHRYDPALLAKLCGSDDASNVGHQAETQMAERPSAKRAASALDAYARDIQSIENTPRSTQSADNMFGDGPKNQGVVASDNQRLAA
jgi:hypothetical protein